MSIRHHLRTPVWGLECCECLKPVGTRLISGQLFLEVWHRFEDKGKVESMLQTIESAFFSWQCQPSHKLLLVPYQSACFSLCMGCLTPFPTPRSSIFSFLLPAASSNTACGQQEPTKLRVSPDAIYIVPGRNRFPTLLGEKNPMCLGFI